MSTLRNQHKDLEVKVFAILLGKINLSSLESKHVQTKCIKVNVYDYTEMIIINDELVFLDNNGYHYSIYAECSLEDLIDIIEDL